MRSCPCALPCQRQESVPVELLSRREWVKCFVLGSASAIGLGGWKETLLADISPGANPANILAFKISDYPVLQSNYGSVRFSLFGATVPNGIITITRAPGNIFYAVSAYCTHQGNIVDAYDHSEGTEAMICYSHGSTYDIQGRVMYPAEEGQANLPTYATSFANGVVRVEIPNLNLRVNTVALASTNGATKRFQISFPAKNGASYKIKFTPDLVTAAVPVSVATSVGGTANVSQINQLTNTTRNVWVDSTAERGFYVVEMLVTPYVP